MYTVVHAYSIIRSIKSLASKRRDAKNLPYGTRLKQKFMEQFVRFTLPKLHGCKFTGLVLMASALPRQAMAMAMALVILLFVFDENDDDVLPVFFILQRPCSPACIQPCFTWTHFIPSNTHIVRHKMVYAHIPLLFCCAQVCWCFSMLLLLSSVFVSIHIFYNTSNIYLFDAYISIEFMLACKLMPPF